MIGSMGGYQLTLRETELAVWLMITAAEGEQGWHTVATRMAIGPDTVKAHQKSVYSKLGLDSQRSLIALVTDALDDPASSVLNPDGVAAVARRDLDDLKNALLARLYGIADRHAGPEVLRQAVRVALPLDADSRRQWRRRLVWWSHARNSVVETARTDLRDVFVDFGELAIRRLQEQGAVGAQSTARQIAVDLNSLVEQGVMRLLRDPRDQDALLNELDRYIDAVAEPRRAPS